MKASPATSYEEMIKRRIRRDPGFASELFNGAVSGLFEGDFRYALRTLRCIVSAGIGFSALSRTVGISSQNLHRALSDRGNPTIRTLNRILSAIADALGVSRPSSAMLAS